ncbi:MAG: septation protein spoVG [Clostridia bacterium]|nr:septation protein spoVG [Clostridia bacterium]
MKYSINVTEAKNQEGNVRGFASLVFGDSFKITNIAILENKEKDTLFVSMPRYKSAERDENGGVVYKDVCNPITSEFRKELYDNILEAFGQVRATEGQEFKTEKSVREMPEFSVTVTPYEREGSNIRGLARIYFDDSFIVNNVSILQGKENLFVAMPSYKTKQTDEQGKAVYQDVCYPVTKEFREKLYAEIVNQYEIAKAKKEEQALGSAQTQAQSQAKDQFMKVDGKELPFR